MSYEADRAQLISEFETEAAAIREAFGVKTKPEESSKDDKQATKSAAAN